MGNADSQFVALAIVPKVTASISIPCQFWIIKQVIIDHREKRGKATSRALFGMGCVDICASFGWFLSTWAAPAGTPDVPFASGTTGTCSFQGFLLQLAIGAPMYNCLLSLFYLLQIMYGWSEVRLRKLEPVLHSLVLIFSVGTSIVLLPLGLYNHIGAVCWVMGLPQGCGNSNYQPGDEPCERGDFAWLYGVSLFYGPLWCCIVFTTFAMALIYRNVKRTEDRSSTYNIGYSYNTRSREVWLQALLYTAAFYITWLPSTLWSITQWFGVPMFWLDLLATICEPAQGLLNLLVFIRPRKDLRMQLRQDITMLLSCGQISRLRCCGNDDQITSEINTEVGNAVTSSTSITTQEGQKRHTSADRAVNNSLRTTEHRLSLLNSPDSDDDADTAEPIEGSKLSPKTEEGDGRQVANDYDRSAEEKEEESWEENVCMTENV
mmetsp:Transcript_2028/g.5841  ORF Transcript_2028/g.5841 Transcript_2028/m.5841 type:complete len:435 (+) Transcript_2028:285-1589(+)